MPTDIYSIPLEIIRRIITVGCDDPKDEPGLNPLSQSSFPRRLKGFAALSAQVCHQWRNIVFDRINYHLWVTRLYLSADSEMDLVEQIAEFKTNLVSSNKCDIVAYITLGVHDYAENSRQSIVFTQLVQQCLLWLIPYSDQLWALSIWTINNPILVHFVQAFVSRLGHCLRLRNLTLALNGQSIGPIDTDNLIAQRPFFPFQWHRIRYTPELRFPVGDNYHTINIYGSPTSYVFPSGIPPSVTRLSLPFPRDDQDHTPSLRRLLQMSRELTYLVLYNVFIPPTVNRDELLPLHLPRLAHLSIIDTIGGNNLNSQLLFSMISGSSLTRLDIDFNSKDEADFDPDVHPAFPRLLHLQLSVSMDSQAYAYKWLSKIAMPVSCHLDFRLSDYWIQTYPTNSPIPLDPLDNLPEQTSICGYDDQTLMDWNCRLTSSSTKKLSVEMDCGSGSDHALTSCSIGAYKVDWQNLHELNACRVDIDSFLRPFGYPLCPRLSMFTYTVDHPSMLRLSTDQASRSLSFVKVLNIRANRSYSKSAELDSRGKTSPLLTFLSDVEQISIEFSDDEIVSTDSRFISPTITEIVECLDLSIERLKILDKLQHLDISLSHWDDGPLSDYDDRSWGGLTAMVEEFARWREEVGNPLKHFETDLVIRPRFIWIDAMDK